LAEVPEAPAIRRPSAALLHKVPLDRAQAAIRRAAARLPPEKPAKRRARAVARSTRLWQAEVVVEYPSRRLLPGASAARAAIEPPEPRQEPAEGKRAPEASGVNSNPRSAAKCRIAQGALAERPEQACRSLRRISYPHLMGYRTKNRTSTQRLRT
jgi:hypothetical protein